MNDAYSIREYGLAHLTDHESLTDVLQAFGELVQTGIALYEMDGHLVGELKIHGDSPCAVARRARPDAVPCHAVTLKVLAAAHGASAALTDCPMGLTYATAILALDGEQLGRIVLGPFIPTDDPPPRHLADGLAGLQGVDAAYAHVRRLSRGRAGVYVRSIARVLAAVTYASYKAGVTSQVHFESIRNAYLELEVTNRRLDKALRSATEAARLKSAFLATISHELKTPLTSILGYSEMLMDGTAGELSPSQGEYARTIFEKGEALHRMIAAVLELTRLEGGALSPLFKAGRIDAVITPVVSAHRVTAAAKGIALTVELPAGLPELSFDHEKARMMIDCLVDNAVKFTPPGGAVRIAAAASERLRRGDTGRFGGEPEPHITLTVSDTGPGIPPDVRARIFDPFYQADNSDTREHGGMGIGLRLVKGYVELHGGEIELANGPGPGAAFSIHLPLSPPLSPRATPAAGEPAVPAKRL